MREFFKRGASNLRRRRPIPHVHVLTNLSQNYHHASSTYAGLNRLARNGVITWEIRWPRSEEEHHLPRDPLTVPLIIESVGRWRLIGVDLHDQADIFSQVLLDRCDVYAKRSLHRRYVARLPAEFAAKVVPMGLHYACHTPGAIRRLVQCLGWPFFRKGGPGRLRHLNDHLRAPSPECYEQRPVTRVPLRIIFQTRVWSAHEAASAEEAETLNAQRVGVIRALRKEFGDRFLGGLVRTPLALERYPQDVTPHPSRRTQYIAMSKQALVGIYTHGLHGSAAFKLGEYLAASQCIVGESPYTELPAPLIAGTHYLRFDTIDQCVDGCVRLFEDRTGAAQMRHANAHYYSAHVEPAARMTRILELAKLS